MFLHQGTSITYDGRVHLTTMVQFAQAMTDGEFPVTWTNNFANYGLPLPILAHQIPTYLGAFLILLGIPQALAYKLLMFFAVFLGNLLFYIFLRKNFDRQMSVGGLFIYAFFAYRILNIYTRGALPEIFAGGIFPLAFIAIDDLFAKKTNRGVMLLIVAVAGLALTHPMMLVVYSLVIFLYFVYKLLKKKKWYKGIYFLTSLFVGILISSYYTLPLVIEIKYFYQGLGKSTFDPSKFLAVDNFVDSGWYYFFSHPGPRGHFISVGYIELILLIFGLTMFLFTVIKKRKNQKLSFWLVLAGISIFLTLPISIFLYSNLPGFNQLQFPWRFLNILQIAIPLIFLYSLKLFQISHQKLIIVTVILITLILRIPQLYGKNYVVIGDEYYQFVKSNLHTQNLNTIWSDNSENYPTKEIQSEIVSGQGTLSPIILKNSNRKYEIVGETDLKVVDYTFYFPGWKVFANGREVQIEFQDPNYRGLITYVLPEGKNSVEVRYENTKVRNVGLILSIFGLILFVAMPKVIAMSNDRFLNHQNR